MGDALLRLLDSLRLPFSAKSLASFISGNWNYLLGTYAKQVALLSNDTNWQLLVEAFNYTLGNFTLAAAKFDAEPVPSSLDRLLTLYMYFPYFLNLFRFFDGGE